MRAGRLPIDEQVTQFTAALERNRTLTTVLDRAAATALPGWYLVAGCLYQTVWNVVTGQPPEAGILDYDLAYFDASDLSWQAEDAVTQAGRALFGDLPAPVQIRNQARVHLWCEQAPSVTLIWGNCFEAGEVLFPELGDAARAGSGRAAMPVGLLGPQFHPPDLAGDRLRQVGELQPPHPLVGGQQLPGVGEDRQRRLGGGLRAG